ncbi:MAG: uracil phosphoribosyltransferase [Clostridia bacterium]|nr:uracil phosphoribosyltransferase [Clostridia bacterium]
MEVIEIKHPLIEHKLGILRNKKTGTKEFRELISEITLFLCYEAMKDAKIYEEEIETPITKMTVNSLNENHYVFVPILRAGTGMIDGIVKMIPNAKIGHIGLYRNEETLEPVKYLFKMPKNIRDKEIIIIDPMLATGGSGCAAIQMLKDEGVKDIKFLCVIAAPEGIKRMQKEHSDVKIYCGKIDDHLNDIGYIVPGLGDAGDRIFGTK